MKLGCNHPIRQLAPADMIGLDDQIAVMNAFTACFPVSIPAFERAPPPGLFDPSLDAPSAFFPPDLEGT